MKKPDIFVKSPMMQVADKTQPPILFPTISPNLYTAVGELMVQWALMEQNLNIVIWALLTYNSTNEDGWKKRGFEKRWELLKAEWAKFSKGHEALLKFLDSANHNIRLCKVLRDSLAHKEMTLGMMQDGNHFVQFYNETRTKQSWLGLFEQFFRFDKWNACRVQAAAICDSRLK